MLTAAVKSAAHILLRHMMTSQSHAQGHTLNGLRGRTDGNVVQQDAVATRSRLADQRDVGFADLLFYRTSPARKPW